MSGGLLQTKADPLRTRQTHLEMIKYRGRLFWPFGEQKAQWRAYAYLDFSYFYADCVSVFNV